MIQLEYRECKCRLASLARREPYITIPGCLSKRHSQPRAKLNTWLKP